MPPRRGGGRTACRQTHRCQGAGRGGMVPPRVLLRPLHLTPLAPPYHLQLAMEPAQQLAAAAPHAARAWRSTKYLLNFLLQRYEDQVGCAQAVPGQGGPCRQRSAGQLPHAQHLTLVISCVYLPCSQRRGEPLRVRTHPVPLRVGCGIPASSPLPPLTISPRHVPPRCSAPGPASKPQGARVLHGAGPHQLGPLLLGLPRQPASWSCLRWLGILLGAVGAHRGA